MIEIFSLSILTFVVSVDSFGAGLAYGLRKLQLPFLFLLLISVCSGTSIFIGGMIAGTIALYFPPVMTESLGGIILILLGCWSIYQSRKNKPLKEDKKDDLISTIVLVMNHPDEADLDKSGTISVKESMLLGVALSLDALAAGVSAQFLALSTLSLSIMVGIMCGIFLLLGMKLGVKLATYKVMQKLSFLPGALFIALGTWNLL